MKDFNIFLFGKGHHNIYYYSSKIYFNIQIKLCHSTDEL
jgi:hypothetical protein